MFWNYIMQDRSCIDLCIIFNGKDKSCKNRDIVVDNWISYIVKVGKSGKRNKQIL